MNCNTTEKNLIFFLENKLDPTVSGQLSDHLKDCAHCTQQYHRLQQVMLQIPEMKQSNPNPFLFTRIEQKISNNAQEQQQPIPVFARIFNPLIVSVLMIATAFVGLYLFTQTPATSNAKSGDQVAVIAGQYEMTTSDQDIMETYYLTEE